MQHFTEQGRSVFVSRESVTGDCRAHRITVLPSGDFNVVCTCLVYDEGNIRAQVRDILYRRATEKKSN
jgi:hypothetical protein